MNNKNKNTALFNVMKDFVNQITEEEASSIGIKSTWRNAKSLIESEEHDSNYKEHAIEFIYKGLVHKFTFTPEYSDWWEILRAGGFVFCLNYDELSNLIIVYELTHDETRYGPVAYKKNIN